MDTQHARGEIVRTVSQLREADLVRISAGNVSVRLPDGGLAITPAGLAYEEMKTDDIVVLDRERHSSGAGRRPSSELPMHLEILEALPQIGAIVHTHSPYAMAFACLGQDIPPVCLELMSVGAPVPVAEFACPGTRFPGEIAARVFAERPELKALLLRNHGAVCIGTDLTDAFGNAMNLETGARVYHLALLAGTPVALTTEQMEEVRRVYGSG